MKFSLKVKDPKPKGSPGEFYEATLTFKITANHHQIENIKSDIAKSIKDNLAHEDVKSDA